MMDTFFGRCVGQYSDVYFAFAAENPSEVFGVSWVRISNDSVLQLELQAFLNPGEFRRFKEFKRGSILYEGLILIPLPWQTIFYPDAWTLEEKPFLYEWPGLFTDSRGNSIPVDHFGSGGA